MSLITDFRFALRSLIKIKGLALTVIVTLGLGIGANAAIFSVVRGVLLRPLVNRDQDRLIYFFKELSEQLFGTTISIDFRSVDKADALV